MPQPTTLRFSEEGFSAGVFDNSMNRAFRWSRPLAPSEGLSVSIR